MLDPLVGGKNSNFYPQKIQGSPQLVVEAYHGMAFARQYSHIQQLISCVADGGIKGCRREHYRPLCQPMYNGFLIRPCQPPGQICWRQRLKCRSLVPNEFMPPVTILSEEEVPAGAQAACFKFFYKGLSEPRISEPCP